MEYLKKNYLILIFIVVLTALGTFFIVLPGKDFIKIFSVILAVYLLIAAGTLALAPSDQSRIWRRRPALLAEAAALLALAVLTVLFPVYMVRIVIFLVLIVTPTVKLLTGPDKKRYFRHNFWKYIVGVIFILTVEILVDIAFIILGVALYGLAAFFIYLLIVNSRYPPKPNLFDKYLVRYIIFISNKRSKNGKD